MGSTTCIKCGSSIDPFSYCELCEELLNFKCSSCGFVTETKVHVDCVNANSLLSEDESVDKNNSRNITGKSQDPVQSATASSNKSSPKHDVKPTDMETRIEKVTSSENYPSYTISDIKKSWYSFTKLNADVFLLSTRLSSFYYEQFLQYEKAWGNYWTEACKLFTTFSQNSELSKTDAN